MQLPRPTQKRSGAKRSARKAWLKEHAGKRVREREVDAWRALSFMIDSIGAAECAHMDVYPCTWGDSPQIRDAEEHWHIGHRPGTRHERKKSEGS
jgi:hypothetical protein